MTSTQASFPVANLVAATGVHQEKALAGKRPFLKWSLCCAVLALAFFQFSENTADPDLWGHIVFGQETLATQHVPRTEIYSWTARYQPFFDHEWLSEVVLAGVYMLAGGPGLLLLKIVIGLAAFGLCLRLGGERLRWPERAVAWTLGALAVVEISFGFAPRPQIFTALFLAVELWLLRRIHAGGPSRAWSLALPPLFFFWINLHGGVLAGFGLLTLAAAATTLEWIFANTGARRRAQVQTLSQAGTPSAPPGDSESHDLALPDLGTIVCLCLSVLSSGVAMLLNPWGVELIRWLIGSVLWLRPEIQEWNPTPLNWDHAAFFMLAGGAVLAWLFSRKPRFWWEMAVGCAFLVLGWRSVRNTPLCALVLLALTPEHAADALQRLRGHMVRLEALCREPRWQKMATVALSAIALVSGISAFTLHKDHAFNLEVPADQYPVGALSFMRTHQLGCKTLVFFDWGEMLLYYLPGCPPSIDGRLDTCYSRDLIAEHWKFFRGEPVDPKVLDLDKADLALLPMNLAGGYALAKRSGWTLAYYDRTAMVLVRKPQRFPRLAGLSLPVIGSQSASVGRPALADP